jgi:aminoglycoside phosphotransferase (APT) family kinase protein
MTLGQNVISAVRAFRAGDALWKAERYGSGHIHETYCVRFEDSKRDARMILQRLNTSIFKDPVGLMENIDRVTGHIRRKLDGQTDAHRRVLQLVPTNGGKNWHVDAEGRYWRAYGFIDGATCFDAVSSPSEALEAGKAFGAFQRMLADLPGPRLTESIADFHNTQKRFEAFEQAVEADAVGRLAEAEAEVSFALSRRVIAGALLDAGLPERVTHNDTKLNNVMLDDATGEGICVIDLDTVMPGLAAYDFGDMVRTMTCKAAEDERDLSRVEMELPLFEVVLKGYLEGAGEFLTEQERESLISGAKVIVFEQGIRFLADFIAGDNYYKIDRAAQNLDRARVQFKLLESIERQESAMARFLHSLL